MDAHRVTTPEEQRKFIKGHYAALRAIPQFKDSYIILFGESNLGFEAAHIGEYVVKKLKGRNRVYDERGKGGVLTTNERKGQFVGVAKRYLGFNDAMKYTEPFACGNPFQEELTPENRIKRVKDKFNEQITRFKKIVNVPTLAHSKTTVTYSGKTDAENHVNPRFKDDLVMAWLLGMFFGDLFLYEQLPGINYKRDFAN